MGSNPTIRIRLILVSKLLKRKVIENKIRPKVITFNACCDLEPSKVGATAYWLYGLSVQFLNQLQTRMRGTKAVFIGERVVI